MKYRKKPVTVHATQWLSNGDHPDDHSYLLFDCDLDQSYLSEGLVVRRFRDPKIRGSQQCPVCGKIMDLHGFIDTLEGGHTVCPGDFIITGVKGERYPCKPDIFDLTYEEVSDSG